MKKTVNILLIICLARTIIAQDATVIYKNTVGSTVTIETDIGLGSGFFIEENVIATNYHVIEGATEAYCYINNSSTKFKIDGYLAADKSADLILLQVFGLDRTPIKISTSSVSPGEKVYVIGSPKGLPASISDGMVSGIRDFKGFKLIQITAPISHGSSGGPVLDEKGELIGISVGQYKDGQNLNFAIPKSYLELLLARKTSAPLSITELYSKFGSFTDTRDGMTYKTVKIGTQIWMAENLAYKSSIGCWAYDNKESNVTTYGYLYNWEAAKNVCPTGWHTSTVAEWIILRTYLGGDTVAGGKLKEAGFGHWRDPNAGATNETGFTALPGGIFSHGSSEGMGSNGYWWSSPKENTSYGWFRGMDCSSYTAASFWGDKQNGFSVRCVKDN